MQALSFRIKNKTDQTANFVSRKDISFFVPSCTCRRQRAAGENISGIYRAVIVVLSAEGPGGTIYPWGYKMFNKIELTKSVAYCRIVSLLSWRITNKRLCTLKFIKLLRSYAF